MPEGSERRHDRHAARASPWQRLLFLAALLLVGAATLSHPGASFFSPFAALLDPQDRITVVRQGAWHAYHPPEDQARALRQALGLLRPWHRMETPQDALTYFLYVEDHEEKNAAPQRLVRYRPAAAAVAGETGDWYRLGPLQAAAFASLATHFDAAGHGDLVAWPAVDQMFVPGSTATLIDLETGRSLEIRRRSVMTGLYHADVEPLTAAETARLAAMVAGEWSWERRAVVLQLGDERIAASVNTMPHGGEDISDNAFPGHFCLHTLGSWTHVGQRIDPQHLLRIMEAAGLEVRGAHLPSALSGQRPGGC